MSRAAAVHGVKHRRRCVCPTCDPKGVLHAAEQQRLAARRAAEEATRKLLAASAPPAPPQRRARPAPSPGHRERWKRVRELRAAGATLEAAIAQVGAEFGE